MLQQNIRLTFLIFLSEIILSATNLAAAANYEDYIYKCMANSKIIGYYDKPCEYIPKIAKLSNFEEIIIHSARQGGKKHAKNPAAGNNNCSCDINTKRCITVTAKIFLLNKILRDLNRQPAEKNSAQSQQLFMQKLKKYLIKYNLLKIKYCKK